MLERWRKQRLDSAGDYFAAIDRPPLQHASLETVEKSYASERNSSLRLVLSGGAPGVWASDHFEESRHCTGWNFVAAHAFALQFAGAKVVCYGRRKPKRGVLPRDPLEAMKARLERLVDKAIQTEHETQDPDSRIPLNHDHPLVRLMRHPNPDQSGTQFRYQMGQQIALTGGAIVWTLRDKNTKYDPRGTPREQYVIPTGLAQPQPPSRKYPIGWYRVLPMATYGINLDPEGFGPPGAMSGLLINGGEIDKRETRGIGWPHPLYVSDWLSAVSAGALQTDTIEEMERSIVARFRNEGRPGLIFGWESIEIWSKVSEEEKNAFRADVRNRNSGTHNTGNDLIKPPGMTVDSFDNNPREMDFTGSVPLARNNVLAMHQTPPTVAGLNEAVSYAGLFASLKQYVELKVQPNLDMAFEEQGEEICPAFGPGHSIEAFARSIDDPSLHAQKQDRLQTRGLVTVDEARASEGLGPHPDKEYGKLPTGTTWQVWQQTKQQAEQAKQQQAQAAQAQGQAQQQGAQGNQAHDDQNGGLDWSSLLGDGPSDTGPGTRQEFRDAPDGRADAMGKSWREKNHGPPPWPGAVFDEGSHRWKVAHNDASTSGAAELGKIPGEHRGRIVGRLVKALSNPDKPDSQKYLQDFQKVAQSNGVNATAVLHHVTTSLDSPETNQSTSSREQNAADDYRKLGTQSPLFKAWFGDSKIVDANGGPEQTHHTDGLGKPLPVFHGTDQHFESFSLHKAGSATDPGFLGQGFYFTNDREIADYYANRKSSNKGNTGRVIQAYLSVQNPFNWGQKTQGARALVMRGERLPEEIHDAVIRRTGFKFDASAEPDFNNEKLIAEAITQELIDRGYDGVVADNRKLGTKEYVAFRPSQIKSVDNVGTFDPSNPNINKAWTETKLVAWFGKAWDGKPHSYCSTQVNLPSDAAAKVMEYGKTISPDDLAELGLEDEPHITVKYGLVDDDPEPLLRALRGFGPIEATLGNASVFEGSKHGDVLKIDVQSEDLHRLNALIRGKVATEDKYPDYVPHVTVAYLKPGTGQKYAGHTGLAGTKLRFDGLSFADRMHNKTDIPLCHGDVVTKAFDALTGKALDDRDHRRVSALWLILQGKNERSIIAAAQAFLNDYTDEFRNKLQALIAGGAGISQADIEKLVDEHKLADGYRDALLPVLIASAIAGSKFEWDRHAPADASFDETAALAEDETRKKWALAYWLLLAANLKQHLVDSSMSAVEVARGDALARRGIKLPEIIKPPSVQTLGVTEATATTGVGQNAARDALRMLGIVLNKTWFSVMDGRERQSHHDAHMQTVPADGKFIVGGYPADAPCDPSLPLHERAGCRCHSVTTRIVVQTKKEKTFDESKHPRDHGKFSSGSGDSGSDHHETGAKSKPSLQDHLDTIDSWLSHPDNRRVHPIKRTRIVQALQTTAQRMPPACLDAAMANLKLPTTMYNSLSHLTEAFDGDGVARKTGQLIAGLYELHDDGKGQLHLDYSQSGSESEAIETHAHEMFHALDGKNTYSGTPEWDAAYKDEIQREEHLPEHQHPLSKYASTNAQEGFAEFGRLIVVDPKSAEEMFPKCWGFIKDKGLV